MKKKSEKNCLVQNAVILSKNYFLGIKYLHLNVQYLYILYEKYQMPAAKALLLVEFPVYALRIRNSYEEEKQTRVGPMVL